jgi:type I restriction enzyme R subunit
MTAEPPQKEARTIHEIIEAIWDNRDREYNTRCLIKRLRRIDKEMAGDAREDFAAFIPNGDVGRYAESLSQALNSRFTETMQTLRNSAFQKLLVEYKRKQRIFIIAHETQDVVSSEWRVRGSDGKEYKPADYLAAFATFVKENPEHVDAIGILLERPKDWSTVALSDLREKLAATPQRFTERNLQQAHKIKYDKALADIISMVKHAADSGSPLLTAEERAERAFAKVTAGKTFTEDQQKWLDRIRAHVRENLSIDEDDFATFPIFERAGGWARAQKVFVGALPKIIREVNEAIAV